MKQNDQIEIPVNKKTTFLLFCIFAAMTGICITLCIAMATNPLEWTRSSRFGNPTVNLIFLIPGAIFLGWTAAGELRQLLDKRTGLIINSEGITGSLVEWRVPWSDILDIKSVKEDGYNLLPIIVRNPQDYIDTATDRFEKKGLKNYYDTYGSPIVIPSSLKIDYDHLHQLLLEKMKEYKQQ